jgi:molecular chaperone DnaK (HSP70)
VTGAKASAQIKADRGRLTEEDIERMVADAERYREEDEALAKKIHLRNALEEAVYRVKSSLTERYLSSHTYTLSLSLDCPLPRNDIQGINDLDDVMNWLEYESETASLEEVQKHCDELFKRYGYRVHTLSDEELRGGI